MINLQQQIRSKEASLLDALADCKSSEPKPHYATGHSTEIKKEFDLYSSDFEDFNDFANVPGWGDWGDIYEP